MSRRSLYPSATTPTPGQRKRACPASHATPGQSAPRMQACRQPHTAWTATGTSSRKMSGCWRCMPLQMPTLPPTPGTPCAGGALSRCRPMPTFTTGCTQPSTTANAATLHRGKKRRCSCAIACNATARKRCPQTAPSATGEPAHTRERSSATRCCIAPASSSTTSSKSAALP